MDHSDQSPNQTLAALYAPLQAKLASLRQSCRERVRGLEDAIREAEMWAFRRAARHERDRQCYRLGAALEPTGGLAIDDVVLAGLDALGKHGVLLLAAQALIAPGDASLSDLIMAIARGDAGRAVRAWGVWSRFTWLRELYQKEVLKFERSPAGRGVKRSWRNAPVTAGQAYLALELARYLQVEPPELANRGAAHDWLLAENGNPRFLKPADVPPLPLLADLLA